jgi:hypothetical protein
MRITLKLVLVTATLPVVLGTEAVGQDDALRRGFTNTIRPFLKLHCLECHDKETPEAMFDLSRFKSARDVARGFASWEHVVERLKAGEMPPEDAETQPTAEVRTAVLQWSKAQRAWEAERNAGDPGPVLPRRLSAAEYNYTIRDLTGADIQPARHFPVDPTNTAGFDNSGESLVMTPGLLAKYLDAARLVSDHLVLKPDGLAFASHPIVTETDRDKYCVRRIVEFYRQQNTDYADYFFAAWRLRHGDASDAADSTLASIASDVGVSPKYLSAIRALLKGEDHDFGPIAKLRSMWRTLLDVDPEPDLATVRAGCAAMGEYVTQLRAKLSREFPKLTVRGINKGTQSFVLWRNRQYATDRVTLDRAALHTALERVPADEAAPEEAAAEESAAEEIAVEEAAAEEATPVDHDPAAEIDPELVIPAEEPLQSYHVAAFEAFCAIFPNTFYVSERGREFLDRDESELEKEKQVRLLSAGFHSMMGYFRDDAPLYELVLSEDQRKELDTLWHELDFVANVPIRQHQGYIWFERAESRFLRSEEFDFARAEDKDAKSEEKIRRLADLYLAKAERTGASNVALDAIREYFILANAAIRRLEKDKRDAEPLHLDALLRFAGRAYRRPLQDAERSEIRDFYRLLRQRDRLGHEDAVRDVLVRVLTSPYFCLTVQPSDLDEPIHPISDYTLAGRLSYFLWSSMPDEELLNLAAREELHRPDVVSSQVRRMLGDDRVQGFATEFGGHWLGFRQFQQHNSVDRQRFPIFDDALRQAMFEEPIHFIVDLIQRDGSLLDLLDGDYTFVNAALASHYGVDGLSLRAGEWGRVDRAGQYGRGGLLPMSVFLTKNAPGLRTSPVKRGYWLVRQLLGERIPTPPPDVPELPSNEAELGELTLREVLAKHREHQSCAVCHDRFDSLGVAFEQYGPVGERRSLDLAGHPVVAAATLPDGVEREGISGLRDYLRQHRQEEFIDNLCRKLLSYALGRTLIVSDDKLLREMQVDLVEDDHRLSGVIQRIATSPQFLTQRGRSYRNQE